MAGIIDHGALDTYHYRFGTAASGGVSPGSDTFYGTEGDTWQSDSSATYTTVADGNSLASNGSTLFRVGQTLLGGPEYVCWEAFMDFDLTAIPGTATIDTATLSMYYDTDSTTTDFICYIAPYDYGASFDSSDWRTRAQLAALSPAASEDTSGLSTGSYAAWDDVALIASLTPGAINKFVLWSSRHESSTAPTGQEFGYWQDFSDANPPKLDLSWS
jgi:hypothetical protein